jgi:hypothetical protein
MSERQTTLQRFEEQTRKTIMKTKEGIQNLLDKMRNAKLGLDEPKEEAKADGDDW